MYEISLEHYVKTYVDFKALETVKERGTYDKAIMRFVLDFTRKSAPKRVWGVDRAQLVVDMAFVIERFHSKRFIAIDGKSFAFLCKDGGIRILFADSVDEYVAKLSEIPNAFRSAFEPVSFFDALSEIHIDHVITHDGDRYNLKYSLVDSIVNVLDRIVDAAPTQQ